MNDVFFKPSQKIDSFFPDDFSVDSENFLAFIKAYYEWLQTTRITITNVSGTFQKNERIDGQVSRAHGIIQEVGNGYLVISIKSSLRFSVSENIVGATSGAIANIERIKDNTVRATGNLLEYRDIEKSIDDYVEYLREELFPTIPTKYIQDKKLLATKLKTFFESRSSEESYRFFFKLLYGENIEFRFPGEEILRASDGKFERTNFIRVVPNENVFNFLNKTIRGQTSNAFGTVVDIKRFFFGTTEIAEFTLKLVSGTFLPNETIVDVLDSSLTTTTFGMLTGFNIVDGGSGYTPGDQIIISGDGNTATALVSSVTQAAISALTVNEIGYGYRLNTPAVINNSGTGGSNLAIVVTGITNTYSVTDGSNTYTVGEISRLSIVNRGQNYFRSPIITIEDSTIAAIGLLSDKLIEIDDAGTDYGVGNTLVFTGGSGANAAGQVASVIESVTYDFLLEDDTRIVIDGSFEDILKDEDWDVIGPIRRIELTNFGDGYTINDLPTITVNTTTGSGANLIAFNIQGKSANVSVDTSNNVVGVGSIRAIQIDSPGLNYTSATANASISGDGNANLIPIITGLSVKEGEFLNDDGKIGIRILIDSFFFQDFSYVIKSGLPFSTYRDELKKIIHPAGLQPFGEILITNTLDLQTTFISEEISRYLVQIQSFFNVGIADLIAITTKEIKVESIGANVSSDLIDEKQYTIIVPPSQLNTSLVGLDQEYEIKVNLQGDIAPSVQTNIQPTQYVVSYANIFEAYGITYGDLKIVGSGVWDEDWSFDPVSTLANNRFNEYYQTFTGTQLALKKITVSEINSEISTNLPIVVLIENEVDLSLGMSMEIDVTEMKIDYSPIIAIAVADTSAIGTSELKLETKSEDSAFSNILSTIEIDVEQLILDTFQIDDYAINRILEIESDANAVVETLTTKYEKIQGTVSSSAGSQYQNLLLSDFADVTIGSVSSSTFETALPLVVGNGTTFTTDFAISDIFVANNEYFIVTNVFGDTSLVIDRPPALPFTNVFAYKVIP